MPLGDLPLHTYSSDPAGNEKNVYTFAQVMTNYLTLALPFRVDHGTIASTREHASGKRLEMVAAPGVQYPWCRHDRALNLPGVPRFWADLRLR
jgi:hypothetical protein